MAKRGGGGGATGFSHFSQKWEELLLQIKFFPVGSSLGHLPMKKFPSRTYRLGSKIRQSEGARGGEGWEDGNHPPPPLSKSAYIHT